jgi:hypothetical protein
MGSTIDASLLDADAMDEQMGGSTKAATMSGSTARLSVAHVAREKKDKGTSDFGEALSDSFRLDLDDVNGEVVLLRWGADLVMESPVGEDGARNAELMRYGKGRTHSLQLISHIEGNGTPLPILRRLLQLDGNMLLVPPPSPIADPVGADLMDIPRVLSRIQSDCAQSTETKSCIAVATASSARPAHLPPSLCYASVLCVSGVKPIESYNRLSALTLLSVLKPRMAAHDEGKHDGSVDLLISGCEVSLWLGEQFAADLHRTFPKLKIVTLSANKLLGQLGQSSPVPQLNFAFHDASLDLTNSPILLISQSGGTFATLACANLLQSFTPHIFAVTSEWDTQVASAIRRHAAGKISFRSYIFTTFAGIRPAEPCTVSVAATHQLLTQILLHLMQHVHRHVSPGMWAEASQHECTCGSTFAPSEVAELAQLNASNIRALSDIVGIQEEAGEPICETATSAALRAQGRKWAQHVLEGPISWMLCAAYIAVTVVSANTPFSLIYFAVEECARHRRHSTLMYNSTASCTCDGATPMHLTEDADTYAAWLLARYVIRVLDALVYIFLPWWTTVYTQSAPDSHAQRLKPACAPEPSALTAMVWIALCRCYYVLCKVVHGCTGSLAVCCLLATSHMLHSAWRLMSPSFLLSRTRMRL